MSEVKFDLVMQYLTRSGLDPESEATNQLASELYAFVRQQRLEAIASVHHMAIALMGKDRNATLNQLITEIEQTHGGKDLMGVNWPTTEATGDES